MYWQRGSEDRADPVVTLRGGVMWPQPQGALLKGARRQRGARRLAGEEPCSSKPRQLPLGVGVGWRKRLLPCLPCGRRMIGTASLVGLPKRHRSGSSSLSFFAQVRRCLGCVGLFVSRHPALWDKLHLTPSDQGDEPSLFHLVCLHLTHFPQEAPLATPSVGVPGKRAFSTSL